MSVSVNVNDMTFGVNIISGALVMDTMGKFDVLRTNLNQTELKRN